MGVLELIQQKSFLGREFMTWLWYRSESDPRIRLPGDIECEVEILDQIVLDANYGDARSSVLKGESPATSPEAGSALLEGKKLRQARLHLTADGMEWTAMIDGETLNFSGLKMPKTGKLPFEESLGLRVEYILRFEDLLSELYQTFLTLRMDEADWEKDRQAISKWIGNK